jgi:hypothetical protein
MTGLPSLVSANSLTASRATDSGIASGCWRRTLSPKLFAACSTVTPAGGL